jgi:hypothetical protein
MCFIQFVIIVYLLCFWHIDSLWSKWSAKFYGIRTIFTADSTLWSTVLYGCLRYFKFTNLKMLSNVLKWTRAK